MKIFWQIISVIALIAWAACFALGMSFAYGSSLVIIILMFLAVLVVMWTLTYFMRKFGSHSGSTHHANTRTREIASLVAYIVVSVLTATGVAHFVTVETTIKDEVAPLALENLRHLDTLYGEADTDGSYLYYVENDVLPTYRNKLLGEYADAQTIDTKVAKLSDELLDDGAYNDECDQVLDFTAHCRYAVTYWVPWTIVSYLNQLDESTPKWEQFLVDLSTKSDWTKGQPFKITSDAETDLAQKVTDPSNVYGIWAIIVIIVLQILILLTYITSRDWESEGPSVYKGRGAHSSNRNRSNNTTSI